LLDRPEIRADYGFLLLDGPDERGLDVAIAYQPALVQVYSYQAQQGCTALVDGLGPDGNRDVLNPQNNLTCDLDGDGTLDGNRLFSRPPLVAHLRAAIPYAAQPADLWLVANHWKSKVEDGFTIQYTLPRRLEQAHFVADLAQEIILTDPQADLIVLGDLNDHPGSQPLLELTSLGLVDLWGRLPPPQRYTYNYAGVSQSLDYILLRARWPLVPARVQAAHLNADYPVSWGQDPETIFRSSDHDPLWVELLSVAPQSYLPLVSR
jgi:predicted extracellular nuclease